MPFTETYNFDTSFVALRALVREIIQNTMHTQYPLPSHSHMYVPTWPRSDFHPLADPAAGFGGGQLGAGSQPRVPPKLKTPRI